MEKSGSQSLSSKKESQKMVAPPRVRQKRAARKRKPEIVIISSSESDDSADADYMEFLRTYNPNEEDSECSQGSQLTVESKLRTPKASTTQKKSK
ncbi:hypothetical protein A2U01_0018352 [Trifolium medium]|uniref:Uncharacterized protein n=1 Tax=Trifolium medium TaxID=97028 RepID=A0A392NE69_9FABA|nr:hypothetical protein [Trifolium medium]